MSAAHIIVGESSLCGGVETVETMPNGSPVPREPCGDCQSIARAAQYVGKTPGPSPSPLRPSTIPRVIPRQHKVIISMTSVPARNGTLGPTLESLWQQTHPPSEIRLYLGPGCTDYGASAICVRVKDRGPVTKLSAVADPAVPSSAIVITADDDIVFHPSWLATLLRYVDQHPNEAIGMAGWNRAPLLERGIFERAAGPCDVVEGFAGVAYRKWFFGADVLDPPEHMKWVDDVWISSYLYRAGVVRRVVPGEATMVDIRRSISSGLHTRPDFLRLNQEAARTGFVFAEHAALLARREASL